MEWATSRSETSCTLVSIRRRRAFSSSSTRSSAVRRRTSVASAPWSATGGGMASRPRTSSTRRSRRCRASRCFSSMADSGRKRTGELAGPQERVDLRGDVGHLGTRQLGVDGQRDGLPGRRFRLREVPVTVTEVGEALLEMERPRVVDLVADARLAQRLLERVALGRADDELVVDVTGLGPGLGQAYVRAGQELAVERRVPLPAGVPVLEVAELHPEHGRLEGVEPAVLAEHVMVVLGPRPVLAQELHPVEECFVLADDHAAVADPAQVLRGEEREAR